MDRASRIGFRYKLEEDRTGIGRDALMKTSRKLPPLLALRAFESASRHMSFSRAASELCVTQSAISRHIKNLEDIFQKKLFIRRGRSVLLSPEGQQYFEKITVGFALIEEATNAFASNRDDSVLRLNVLPTLGMRWLAPRLHQFSQVLPNTEVHLISSIEPVNFKSGGADLAIRVGQMETARIAEPDALDGTVHAPLAKIDLEMLDDPEGISGDELFGDILVVVYNPEFIEPPATPAELSQHVLISTVTRPSAWEDWFRIGGLEEAIRGRKQLSFGHFFMSLQAALEGKGIAILPEVLIEQELASGRLRRLFHKAESAGRYYLLFRGDEAEWRKIRLFRRWIRQAAVEYRRNLDE